MQYVINENENIFDVAIKLYGDSVFAVKIVMENSAVITLSNNNIANIEIEYDETVKESLSRLLMFDDVVISDVISLYKVQEGQSIYDLALMWGYGIENITDFIKDIGIENINSIVKNLVISVTKKDDNLSNYLSLQNKVLATDILIINNGLLTDDGDPLLDDDGFWSTVD